MTKRLAVITGGGGAIGLACARRLAARYSLVLTEIDGARLEVAVAMLAEEGVAAAGHRFDLSVPAAAGELAALAAAVGTLGALVHTAGLSPTMANGQRIWDVNLIATARLMEAFRPLAVGGSVAVLVASQAGHFIRDAAPKGLRTLVDDPLASDFLGRVRALDPMLETSAGAYGGSKFGVLRIAEREAVAWGRVGARVVSVSPGIIDTEMGRQEFAKQPMMKSIVEATPLGRMGRADEVAAAVAFLCSEDASFVSGTDLLVDGGSTRQLGAGAR